MFNMDTEYYKRHLGYIRYIVYKHVIFPKLTIKFQAYFLPYLILLHNFQILMKTMPTSMFRLLTGQENPIYI